MLQNVSTLTVLLVCVILECAHAASYQWGWERLPARSKRSTRNGVSVVENWYSVCEEVCGAGYGGLGCNCDAEINIPGNHLLKTDLHGMCPILCENQLGTSKCDCPSATSFIDNNKTSVERNRDRLCSEACKWKFTHLKGCTSCSFAADDTTTDSEFTNDENRSNSDSSESSNDKEDTTSGEESTTEEETTTDESTTEEITTESTTTTTTTQPTTTKSTTPATTTPDWSQLCEALCRNGEGGSLCNCDIPPFF